jgi:hypothetical protein
LRLDKAAYRFAGITLTIIMLIARTKAAWAIAMDRFLEVSVGIAVALALTAVWPGHEKPAPSATASTLGTKAGRSAG